MSGSGGGLLSPPVSCSGPQQSGDRHPPTWVGGDSLLHRVHWLKCKPFPETPSRREAKTQLSLDALWPGTVTPEINSQSGDPPSGGGAGAGAGAGADPAHGPRALRLGSRDPADAGCPAARGSGSGRGPGGWGRHTRQGQPRRWQQHADGAARARRRRPPGLTAPRAASVGGSRLPCGGRSGLLREAPPHLRCLPFSALFFL